MIVNLLFHKIKSLTLMFINLFRRALCCFRRHRRSSCDSVPLTHVISNIEGQNQDTQNWGNWEEGSPNRPPKTVQDHIELYRKTTQIATTGQESPEPEEQLNFFEDMTPKITKQMKVLINTDHAKTNTPNRLNFVDGSANAVIPTSELREWEDSSGWENEKLERDAQVVLRETKRQERERRAMEQQQKRYEKISRPLGSKLSTY